MRISWNAERRSAHSTSAWPDACVGGAFDGDAGACASLSAAPATTAPETSERPGAEKPLGLGGSEGTGSLRSRNWSLR